MLDYKRKSKNERDVDGCAEASARAHDPENGNISRNAAKLATVEDPGANGKPRGIVRGRPDQNSLEWKDESEYKEDKWVRAVYLEDIRRKLLDEASNHGEQVYTYPRNRGESSEDETAFHEDQKDWGEDVDVRPDILNRLEPRGYQGPNYDVGFMFDEGRVVLDTDRHPVRDFKDLPVVLSSQLEGYLMEAISRTDPRIEQKDYRARMPRNVQAKDGKFTQLFGLSAIGNRPGRYRKKAGLLSWLERAGSKTLNNWILTNKVSQSDREANNGRNVEPLTKQELEKAMSANKGLEIHMKKAGPRRVRLTQESTKQIEKQTKKTLAAPSIESSAAKRSSAQAFDGHLDIGEVPVKRQKYVKLEAGESSAVHSTRPLRSTKFNPTTLRPQPTHHALFNEKPLPENLREKTFAEPELLKLPLGVLTLPERAQEDAEDDSIPTPAASPHLFSSAALQTPTNKRQRIDDDDDDAESTELAELHPPKEQRKSYLHRQSRRLTRPLTSIPATTTITTTTTINHPKPRTIKDKKTVQEGAGPEVHPPNPTTPLKSSSIPKARAFLPPRQEYHLRAAAATPLPPQTKNPSRASSPEIDFSIADPFNDNAFVDELYDPSAITRLFPDDDDAEALITAAAIFDNGPADVAAAADDDDDDDAWARDSGIEEVVYDPTAIDCFFPFPDDDDPDALMGRCGYF